MRLALVHRPILPTPQEPGCNLCALIGRRSTLTLRAAWLCAEGDGKGGRPVRGVKTWYEIKRKAEGEGKVGQAFIKQSEGGWANESEG